MKKMKVILHSAIRLFGLKVKSIAQQWVTKAPMNITRVGHTW
jgi:hypothetical protein